MKQTAVEWLLSELPHLYTELLKPIIKQAKEMEKKQIMDSFSKGHIESSLGRFCHSEQYYNETFKQQDDELRIKHD